MSFVPFRSPPKVPVSHTNWEEGVLDVCIEPCDPKSDPLGFRAVFLLNEEKARLEKQKSFVIGASFLAKRELNLKKAGYQVPMTERAIALIESKLGQSLPLVLA
jgi:hypothetical protein